MGGAIVQNHDTYWVNVTSGALKPRDYPPASQTTTTTPSTITQFPKDPGCGKTIACYGDCQTNDLCTFLATWYQKDQWLIVSLKSVVTSSDNVWAAIGFGTQAKMASIGVSEVRGGVVEGVFACTLRREMVVGGGGPQVYNLTSTPFHILMARGTASGWTIQPHAQADAFVTYDSYDVTDHVDIGGHAQSINLVKLHGGLMTVAWIMFASIGVLVARFYKPAWHTQTVCDVQLWFAIDGPNYEKAHPILGVIVTVLTVLNPIMAMFRCHPSHEYRPLFNWLHFFVGTSAYILGVVTLGIGIHIPLGEVPGYALYSVIGFGAWHLLAHVMLEVTKCCERNDSMVGVYKDLQSFSRSFDAVGYHHFRQTVFTLHVIIALGVSVAIICAIIGL
ncbi:hypothetical protein ACOMHN_030480 [Nucella lapillus]